jgi:hypothetical protein
LLLARDRPVQIKRHAQKQRRKKRSNPENPEQSHQGS